MSLFFHGLNAGFSRGPAFSPVSTWRVFTTSSLLLMEKHNLTCTKAWSLPSQGGHRGPGSQHLLDSGKPCGSSRREHAAAGGGGASRGPGCSRENLGAWLGKRPNALGSFSLGNEIQWNETGKPAGDSRVTLLPEATYTEV